MKVPNLYYLAIFQDLIHVDVKSLDDLTREGHEDGNFNPAQSLGNIFNLINGLSSKIKAEGQYLLKRDAAQNAAFVQVEKSNLIKFDPFWSNLIKLLGNVFNLISSLCSKIKAEGQYLLKRDAAKNAAFVQGVYCWILTNIK